MLLSLNRNVIFMRRGWSRAGLVSLRGKRFGALIVLRKLGFRKK